MKTNVLIILIFLPLVLSAQTKLSYEYPRFRWSAELGFEATAGKPVKMPQIRENKSAYFNPAYEDDLYYCGFMFDTYSYTRWFVGFKPEYSLNHYFSVAAGVRFMYNNSVFNSDRDYFLWKVSEAGPTTDYVRIKNFEQNNFYLGIIPAELKIFSSQRDLRVRQYFTVGLALNTLINTSTKVNFKNSSMENEYNDMIKSQLQKPSAFSAQAFLGMGLKIGRMKNPFGSVEIQMPINLIKNTHASSFIDYTPVSFEMTAQIYFPTGNKKLSYNYRNRR